jgi:hypothetical protein
MSKRPWFVFVVLMVFIMVVGAACNFSDGGPAGITPNASSTETSAPVVTENDGPQGFSATLTAPDVVLLEWQAVENATGYDLQLDFGNGEFATIALLPPDATSFEDLMAAPDSELTYRLQTLTASGPAGATRLSITTQPRQPNPLTVQPTYDEASAVSARIGPTGGTLSVTDARGVTYTLDIPAGRLLEETEIRMTPVATITDWPLNDEPIGGVLLEPEGLRLEDAATLTISGGSAQVAPDLAAVGFAFDGNGQEFHLRPSYPVTTETSSQPFGGAHFSLRAQTNWQGMVISLTELLGYGSGSSDAGVAADLVKKSTPTDDESAAAQKEAAAQVEDELAPLPNIKVDPAQRESNEIAASLLAASNCKELAGAIERSQQWSQSQKSGSSLAAGEIQLRERSMTKELVKNLIDQIDRISDACVENKPGQAIDDIPCVQGILRNMAQGASDFWRNAGQEMKKQAGVSDLENQADALDNCKPSYKVIMTTGLGRSWVGDCIDDLTKPFTLYWTSPESTGSFEIFPGSSDSGKLIEKFHVELGGTTMDYKGTGRYEIIPTDKDPEGRLVGMNLQYHTTGNSISCVESYCVSDKMDSGKGLGIPFRVQVGVCPKPTPEP